MEIVSKLTSISRSLYVLAFLFLLSCQGIDMEYINANVWEYDRGCKFGTPGGGAIVFDSKGICHVSRDTLIINNKPIGIISKLDKRKGELYLKAIDNDSVGVFYNGKQNDIYSEKNKQRYGLEALEEQLNAASLDYVNPFRRPIAQRQLIGYGNFGRMLIVGRNNCINE